DAPAWSSPITLAGVVPDRRGKEAPWLFEEVVERLARAGWAGRSAGLPFNGRTRLEQRAGIAFVLCSNSRNDRLGALPARAGVKRQAVDATMNVDAAFRTTRIQFDRN